MANEDLYTQVQLQHEATGMIDVAWIPSQLARVGARLTIGKVGGFRVLERYATQPKSFIDSCWTQRQRFTNALAPHR